MKQKLTCPFCRWEVRPRELQRLAQDYMASKRKTRAGDLVS